MNAPRGEKKGHSASARLVAAGRAAGLDRRRWLALAGSILAGRIRESMQPLFEVAPAVLRRLTLSMGLAAVSPALNEEGPQRRLSSDGSSLALLRQINDGTAASLFLANPSSTATVVVDVAAMISGVPLPDTLLRDATPTASRAARSLTYRLQPLE